MKRVELPGGSCLIREDGDPFAPDTFAPILAESMGGSIAVDSKGNCKKANARTVEKCKSIRQESPTATHTITVTIDGVRGRIPFIPDK